MRLFLALLVHSLTALILPLEPRAEHCLTYASDRGSSLSFLYEALPEEADVVEVRLDYQLVDEHEKRVGQPKKIKDYPSQHYRELNLSADSVHDTQFLMCFRNPLAHKIRVAFYMEDSAAPQDFVTQQHTLALQNSIQALDARSKTLLQQQAVTNTRELQHSIDLKGSHKAVLRWRSVQAFLILLMSAYQIYYIERLFNSGKSIL